MSSAFPDGLATVFWGLLYDLACDYSDWREVACVSDSVVGFAFGRERGPLSTREIVGSFGSYLSAMVRIARNSSCRFWVPMLITCILSELKIQLKSPGCEGEVAFLVVDGKHRGAGIGRHLLNRFIGHALDAGVNTMSVYTTDPGCNWQFYQAQGFEKAVEFDDDVGAYLEGSPSKGLILTLDLNTRR